MNADIQIMSFNDAETQWKNGRITDEQFNEYCYEFRNQTFRYSELGQLRARWHAEANGLPMAYSDRAVN